MTTPFKRRAIAPAAAAAAVATTEHLPTVQGPAEALASTVVSIQDRGARSHGHYQVGQIYDIPLNKFKPNPANARAIYTEAAQASMVESFRERGQLMAVLGFEDSDGAIILIDGQRRYRAAVAAGFTTLRVEIKAKPESDQQLYMASRAANNDREGQSPLDDALVWRKLLDNKTFASQAALARALAIDEAYVSRTLQLNTMPQTVLNSITQFPTLLTFQMLNALREYCAALGEEAILKLIPEVVTRDLGYRDVVARKNLGAHQPSKRPRADKERIRFGSGKGEMKTFEESGRVELTLTGLTEAELQAVRTRLKEALVPQTS